jgi:DNA repair protein RecN (Recombination protein N)
MLSSLSIRNVVLIEQLTIDFAAGFCALTGETGAGKSILLDSLGLALGGRADSGLVRRGADQASVTAEFDLPKNHPVLALLKEQGLETTSALVLRRVLMADGKSRAFINDQPVSVGLLRQAGLLLVEIHGQFDTHGLFDVTTHRGLLDDYAKINAAPLARQWQVWQDTAAQLKQARDDAERARADEEYLRHVVAELDELRPEEGEEQSLSELRDKMKQQEFLLSAYGEAWEAISGEDGAELSIARAAKVLERLGNRAPSEIDGVIQAMDRAAKELQDAVNQLESLQRDLQSDDVSAEEIEDRLYALRAAARKHGCRADELPAMRETLAAKVGLIDRSGEILRKLEAEVKQARAAFIATSDTVNAARRKAAAKLDGLVAKELPPLKLDKARFVTGIEALPETQWGPGGTERVQFLVATNPGAEPGPLGKIASGGEMARFMLALKVVMATVGSATSYIFDEVDTGIGGATAAAVGERLARLAQSRQVLVVTHSPQVAARAPNHWIVMKQGAKNVRTTVIPLTAVNDRRDEIARMLSGATVTDEARKAAERLLETGS